jgi:glyoxylate reductase
MAHIVVARRLPAPALALLDAAGADWEIPEEDRGRTPEELRALAAGADVLVTTITDRVDEALLDAAPRLRGVCNVAVGYDNIDAAACAARGVRVTNTPGVLTDATADLAMALILAVTRRIGEGERRIRSGEPWAWAMDFMLGRGLRGRTLGIVGLGQIGRATAERARAFGMEIVYAQRSTATDAPWARRLTLEELFEESDVISLHCPLTEATHHLVDADRLVIMKPDAYLINTARGPVVDEAALAEALRTGEIAGAGIDVFEREPEVHPDLVAQENAVLVPHLGSATIETRTAMAELAIRNALALAAGEDPVTPVA